MQRLAFLAFVFLLNIVATQADELAWKKTRLLITPGVGLGPIVLGKEIQPEAKELLGNPEIAYGRAYWGDGSSGGFPTGIIAYLDKDDSVSLILIYPGVRAYTKEGFTLDKKLEAARRLYPNANHEKVPFERTFAPAVLLPGLGIQGSPYDDFIDRVLIHDKRKAYRDLRY